METTTDPSKIKVYIENTDRGVLYHSNFLSEGAKNPTKIVSENPIDLDVVIQNLVFNSADEAQSSKIAMRDLSATVEVNVDRSMFDENGYTRADLSGFDKISLVDGRAQQSLPVPILST